MELVITIISGVGVFFLSQIVMEFYIKPIQEYRELRRKISVLITQNENYYTTLHLYEKCSDSERDKRERISDETRTMASELRGFIETMPLIHIGIPRRKALFGASAELIGLSNGLFEDFQETFHGYAKENVKNIQNVKRLLKLYGI